MGEGPSDDELDRLSSARRTVQTYDDGSTEVATDNWRYERSAHRLPKAPWMGRTASTMPDTARTGDEPDEAACPGETQKWVLDRQRWKDYAHEGDGQLIRIDHGSVTLKGLINLTDPRSRLVTSRKTVDLDSGEIIAYEKFHGNEVLQ